MQFITVKESHYASDLTVLKSRLEAEGVQCRFKDELTTQVLSHLSTITVELQVANNDLDKAFKIMKANGEVVPEKDIVLCPKCNSDDIKVQFNLGNILKIGASIFKTLFTFKSLSQVLKSACLKCQKCGFVYRNG